MENIELILAARIEEVKNRLRESIEDAEELMTRSVDLGKLKKETTTATVEFLMIERDLAIAQSKYLLLANTIENLKVLLVNYDDALRRERILGGIDYMEK